MSLPKISLLALGVVLSGAIAPGSAYAQNDKPDKPIDLKPLIPPAFSPLPPNSQLTPGTVGGTTTPYTTAPLQNPTSRSPPAPGIKLTIPSRNNNP
jgi:hypothetical protein